jgi:hypothetical protein
MMESLKNKKVKAYRGNKLVARGQVVEQTANGWYHIRVSGEKELRKFRRSDLTEEGTKRPVRRRQPSKRPSALWMAMSVPVPPPRSRGGVPVLKLSKRQDKKKKKYRKKFKNRLSPVGERN